MLPRQLRFRDLKERGIVSNRVTLGTWIAKCGFPRGRLVGGNTRMWTEDMMKGWYDAQLRLSNRVYLTICPRLATFYAICDWSRAGVVYIVEPRGEVLRDKEVAHRTDCFHCDRARIVGVMKQDRVFAELLREKIQRRGFRDADEAYTWLSAMGLA